MLVICPYFGNLFSLFNIEYFRLNLLSPEGTYQTAEIHDL